MTEQEPNYTTRFAATRALNRKDDPSAWAVVPAAEAGKFTIAPKASTAAEKPAAAPRKPRAKQAAAAAGKKPKRVSPPDRVTWSDREAQAAKGRLPAPLDLTAPTRQYLQKRHDEIMGAAKSGDVKALKAIHIKPTNSNYVALARLRDLCVTAIHAKA
jgi:hypothetical protein